MADELKVFRRGGGLLTLFTLLLLSFTKASMFIYAGVNCVCAAADIEATCCQLPNSCKKGSTWGS